MSKRVSLAGAALCVLACGVTAQALASGPPPPFSELRFLQFDRGQVFDNLSHLAGAIDLSGASSVPVNGLRGVWGLGTTSRFNGTLIDSVYIDTVRVGVHWEISGLRDLISVASAPEAALFGHSTGGTVKVLSKLGSDSLDPLKLTPLGQIRPPQKLIMQVSATITGDIAEYSLQTNGSSPAVYSIRSDTLTRVAGAGDAVPGRPGSTFTDFAPQHGYGYEFMFFGGKSPAGLSSLGFDAVYRHRRDTGELVPVLVNDPATNPYGVINGVAFDNGRLAVAADKGLLLTDQDGAAPLNIVPAGTEYAPGVSVSTIRDVRMAGERIAFTSFVDGASAAFVTGLDGSFTKIADRYTPVPGGIGTFSAAQQIGISDELVAFIGFDSSFAQAGLFGFVDDVLFRIAGPGDVKDGKTVGIVDFLPDAIDRNVLAYTAYFTDGSSAAYLLAVVPEPAQWLLLAAGLALLRVRVRWREMLSPWRTPCRTGP
jgi:hypothetical protein